MELVDFLLHPDVRTRFDLRAMPLVEYPELRNRQLGCQCWRANVGPGWW